MPNAGYEGVCISPFQRCRSLVTSCELEDFSHRFESNFDRAAAHRNIDGPHCRLDDIAREESERLIRGVPGKGKKTSARAWQRSRASLHIDRRQHRLDEVDRSVALQVRI